MAANIVSAAIVPVVLALRDEKKGSLEAAAWVRHPGNAPSIRAVLTFFCADDGGYGSRSTDAYVDVQWALSAIGDRGDTVSPGLCPAPPSTKHGVVTTTTMMMVVLCTGDCWLAGRNMTAAAAAVLLVFCLREHTDPRAPDLPRAEAPSVIHTSAPPIRTEYFRG